MTDAQWAIVIAGLSLAASVFSLGWNIFTWVRQKARIKVTLHWGDLFPDSNIVVHSEHPHLSDTLALVDRSEVRRYLLLWS